MAITWIKLWLNLAYAGTFAPPQGTDIARQVDDLYGFLLVISAFSCAILIGGMVYFAYKYKRKTATDKTAYITHNTFLEFLWSFIPLVIFMVVFAWGWYIYREMRSMPKDAFEVQVQARQWSWEFQYKSGASSDTLYVPVNKDIKLVMTSSDVLHSFYVPSFRIKQDVVPGRYTALWFKAEKLGDFHVFCAEFCGTEHSKMGAIIKVVTQEEFDKWLEEQAGVSSLPLAEYGKKLFGMKCTACHSASEPVAKIGPSLFKKFGTKEILDDGSEVLVDENYVRESILDPQAKIVKGFGKVMTSFQGQLSEKELSAIIEYIKSAK